MTTEQIATLQTNVEAVFAAENDADRARNMGLRSTLNYAIGVGDLAAARGAIFPGGHRNPATFPAVVILLDNALAGQF